MSTNDETQCALKNRNKLRSEKKITNDLWSNDNSTKATFLFHLHGSSDITHIFHDIS